MSKSKKEIKEKNEIYRAQAERFSRLGYTVKIVEGVVLISHPKRPKVSLFQFPVGAPLWDEALRFLTEQKPKRVVLRSVAHSRGKNFKDDLMSFKEMGFVAIDNLQGGIDVYESGGSNLSDSSLLTWYPGCRSIEIRGKSARVESGIRLAHIIKHLSLIERYLHRSVTSQPTLITKDSLRPTTEENGEEWDDFDEEEDKGDDHEGSNPRKTIHISSHFDQVGRHFVLAVCDDGTIWQLDNDNVYREGGREPTWEPYPTPPPFSS